MNNTLDAIELPVDIWWSDEIDWTPVEQSVEFSTTGALLIDLSTKQAGRPITLIGDERAAWISREAALALQAAAAVPGKQMTLVINDQTFTVMFRHEEKKALDTEPMVKISPPADDDIYILKALKLMAV